jgi:hypothetical protein
MEHEKRYSMMEVEVGGFDYRTIADIMTVDGRTMGHSTVRNVVMRVLERFAMSLMAAYGVVEDPAVIARSPAFQKLIAVHLHQIYGSK